MKRIRVWGARVIMTATLASPAFAAEPSAGPPTANTTFDLVTESEATTWNTTRPKDVTDFSTRDLREDNSTPSCHSTADNDADNPKIRIVAPTLEKPLIAPIDIDLQFVPTGSSHVRPETFRVCYMGLVSMDITKRITDHVTVSEQGLHVTGAQLPRGHHRLLFLIADQRGRLARHEAIFNVL